MVEYWDVYTMNRLKTGRVMERGAAFCRGGLSFSSSRLCL